MNKEDTSEKIKNYILEKFPLARKRAIGNEDPLLEGGVLDSMGVLELVEFIEIEFQITVSDEDLLPENFQSIGRIVSFICHKITSGAGGLECRGGLL